MELQQVQEGGVRENEEQTKCAIQQKSGNEGFGGAHQVSVRRTSQRRPLYGQLSVWTGVFLEKNGDRDGTGAFTTDHGLATWNVEVEMTRRVSG